MLQECPLSCSKQPGIRKFHYRTLNPGEISLFDLEATAKDDFDTVIDLDRFHGYLTIVTAVPSKCGLTEAFYDELMHLHDVWPYGLEFMVFPSPQMIIPGMANEADGFENSPGHLCPEMHQLDKHKKHPITVMETADVNGPRTHPVYKYLKEMQGITDIVTHQPTYFIILPEGDMEIHQGVTPYSLKNHIRRNLKQQLEL
jgi:glutathione peroxidase-family protein